MAGEQFCARILQKDCVGGRSFCAMARADSIQLRDGRHCQKRDVYWGVRDRQLSSDRPQR